MPMTLQDPVSHVNERKSPEESAAPILSAAEQTRQSWARPVRSIDELPLAYHPFFEALPADAFPYAVLTPTFTGFMRRETERLVCCIDDRLVILEKTSGAPKCTTFPLAHLNYVEVGAVLLKAWIKFSGFANESALTTVTLRFNAVTDRLFIPFLDRIRGAGTAPIDDRRDIELSQLGDAALLSFKFRNYARHSILPGAQVITALGQPELRRTVVRIGRWSFRHTIVMAHVLILTDRELIIIRDDPDSPAAVDNTRYGGVWDYIPLSKIGQIVLAHHDVDRLALKLTLPHGDQIESLFGVDQCGAVERFLSQLIEWAPEATLQRAG